MSAAMMLDQLFPKDFDAPTRRALTDKYGQAIQQQIVPAYRRLRASARDRDAPRVARLDGEATW